MNGKKRFTGWREAATGAVLGLWGLSAAWGQEASDRDRGPAEEPGTEKADTKKELDIDEAYVREHLKGHLRPTQMDFKPDGRVELSFDLSKKSQDHAGIFKPKVGQKITDAFRWTTGREEHIDFFGMEGLKFANRGVAVLDCWFLPEGLEAEIEYIHRGSFHPRYFFALAFLDGKNRNALGNNMGTQCAFFKSGQLTKKRKGSVEALASGTRTRFKLVLKPAVFEAHKNGRKHESLEYKTADFASGKLGFVWGGGLAASVSWLRISGRIDPKAMARSLRRGRLQHRRHDTGAM